ncbi:MAG: S-layer homology domain-containing protein [Candidatus Limnocylindria bacterium]
MGRQRGRSLLLCASLVLAAVSVVGVAKPQPVGSSSEALPDLAMAPLGDFRIETVNGRRLLRFTAMMVNVGAGHFEVRGSRSSTSQPMRMSQVLYQTTARNSPVARSIATDAVASHAGDGHNHWHVNEMMRYDMWGERGTFRGAKVGFCFLDSDPWATSLPGYHGSYYRGSTCGTDPNQLSNRMGISVGWGDEYEYYLAWQWVDITNVPAGTYTVRANVDPYGFFVESNETNQCAWARVGFGASGTGVAVEASGRTCVNDIDDSIFANDIAWAYDAGITVGCAPNLFCTSNAVTREQMASFLARVMDLPPATRDYFADDSSSNHQADINRVAEAGITAGCTATRFCPSQAVTREQMASLLARALDLPPATTDRFTDDGISQHESNINRIAEAQITGGCATDRFCPRSPVTRGQMAAFLHRAFD